MARYMPQGQGLNLPFNRRWGGDDSSALRDLQNNSRQWVNPIQNSVSSAIERGGNLKDLLGDMQIDGVSVKEMFENSEKYLSVINGVIRLLGSISDTNEVKVITEDITHILGMMAVMCKDMSHHFRRDNAEETWRALLRHAELIHEEMNESYERYREIYDQVYNLLCTLLPPRLQFVIRIASTIAALAWPHRERIARWIAHNWKEALGTAAVFAGLALLGGAVYLGYKALTADNRRNNRRN